MRTSKKPENSGRTTASKRPKRARDYYDELVHDLKNPVEAAAYLNAHLQDEEGDTEELFLLALRNIAKAKGFGATAATAGLGRASMYKALSKNGNPRLTTMRSLLSALGLRLSVEVKPRTKRVSGF